MIGAACFPRKARSLFISRVIDLGGREFGDGLGALRYGVLGKLTGKHEADGGLDLARREGGLLVVGGELSSLAGDALEDVVDERVHDAHALLADAGVGVDLLEHLVDVGGVGFHALLAALLLVAGGGDLLGSLGGCLLGGCLGHGGNERCENRSKRLFMRGWMSGAMEEVVDGRAAFHMNLRGRKLWAH